LGLTFGAGPGVDATVITGVDPGKRGQRKGARAGDEIVEVRWLQRDDEGNRAEVVKNATVLQPQRVSQHVVEVLKKGRGPRGSWRMPRRASREFRGVLFLDVACLGARRGIEGGFRLVHS